MSIIGDSKKSLDDWLDEYGCSEFICCNCPQPTCCSDCPRPKSDADFICHKCSCPLTILCLCEKEYDIKDKDSHLQSQIHFDYKEFIEECSHCDFKRFIQEKYTK